MAATEDDVITKLDQVNLAIAQLEAKIAEAMGVKTALQGLQESVSSITSSIAINADHRERLTAVLSALRPIEADAAGSWQLDKATGIMTTFDTQGEMVAKFHVEDSEKYGHKERRTDLEV